MVTDLVAVARWENNLSFINVKVIIDLSTILKKPGTKYSTTTFMELPCKTKNILNGTNATRGVTTFHGNNNIKTYTATEFRTDAMQKTRRKQEATLTAAAFGMTDAKFDVSTIGEEFFGQILEGEMAWFKTKLFKTICPGTAYCPSAALSWVKQVFEDNNGNETGTSTHVYFMNLLIGVSCMRWDKFEVDVVTHAIDHMDPDIRAQLEANYSVLDTLQVSMHPSVGTDTGSRTIMVPVIGY